MEKLLFLLVVLAGIMAFLKKTNLKDEEKLEGKKLKVISVDEFNVILNDWFKKLNFIKPEYPNIGNIKVTAKLRILKDIENILNSSKNLNDKKQELIKLTSKNYALNLDNIHIPEKFKNYDEVDPMYLEYFFKEYKVNYQDLNPSNIEDKLKELFTKAYQAGIDYIKDSMIFSYYINKLKNKSNLKEIEEIIESIRKETEYYLKRIDY